MVVYFLFQRWPIRRGTSILPLGLALCMYTLATGMWVLDVVILSEYLYRGTAYELSITPDPEIKSSFLRVLNGVQLAENLLTQAIVCNPCLRSIALRFHFFSFSVHHERLDHTVEGIHRVSETEVVDGPIDLHVSSRDRLVHPSAQLLTRNPSVLDSSFRVLCGLHRRYAIRGPISIRGAL